MFRNKKRMEVVMSQTRTVEGVKNIVLVHGGFVDGSGWRDVYRFLKSDGYSVAVVQNPTISLMLGLDRCQWR